MSLRRAVNAYCRSCIYDPGDIGTAAQQIACCIVTECPLYPFRPITTKAIPLELLHAYRLSPDDLDDRARGLVNSTEFSAGDAQNEPL